MVTNLLFLLIYEFLGFNCHENGANVISYAPMRQLVITGGKRGYICIHICKFYKLK